MNGDPVPGIKVLFTVYDLDYSISDFFTDCDGLYHVTNENGSCSISYAKNEFFPAGKYIVEASLMDTEDYIYEELPFVYYWHRLDLPSTLRVIESESFENTGAQAVFIPEGCQSICARAFAGCPELLYVWIPSSITDVDPTAFEGCSSDLVVDWDE